MNFDEKLPIYLQLTEIFSGKIISGQWLPGEKIDSVRELAIQYKVNPNTVQKALMDMERGGLVFTERASGRFVTQDAKGIAQARDEKIRRVMEDFLLHLEELGCDSDEAKDLLEKYTKEGVKKHESD